MPLMPHSGQKIALAAEMSGRRRARKVEGNMLCIGGGGGFGRFEY